jgi:hypothetical protein
MERPKMPQPLIRRIKRLFRNPRLTSLPLSSASNTEVTRNNFGGYKSLGHNLIAAGCYRDKDNIYRMLEVENTRLSLLHNFGKYRQVCKPARLHVIKEYGAKLRAIFIHHPMDLVYFHKLRQTAQPKIIGNIHVLLDTEVTPVFPVVPTVSNKYYYFCSDLADATDYLSRELFPLKRYKLIVQGKSFFPESIPQGNPLTWLILTIVHLYVAKKTFRWYFVNGDDLVAVCTKTEIEKYQSLIKQLGLVLNKDKCLISKTRFVYLKNLYYKGRRICRTLSVKVILKHFNDRVMIQKYLQSLIGKVALKRLSRVSRIFGRRRRGRFFRPLCFGGQGVIPFKEKTYGPLAYLYYNLDKVKDISLDLLSIKSSFKCKRSLSLTNLGSCDEYIRYQSMYLIFDLMSGNFRKLHKAARANYKPIHNRCWLDPIKIIDFYKIHSFVSYKDFLDSKINYKVKNLQAKHMSRGWTFKIYV